MIFWATGALAFVISPIADNLTTALLMGAVVMAVGGDNRKFVVLACINVVVAANAGGAFSPFGDITTLMVWQKGKVQFSEFFNIFFPSLVNWLIPAVVMSLAIEKGVPKTIDENVEMRYGAKAIMAFFLVTIATAVCFHNFLHLPPVAGMMLGLGFLGPLSYHIKRHEGRSERYDYILGARGAESVYPITTIVKSKLDLSAIMEKVSLPAFAIDTHHTITHWNKACEAFTGINAQEVIGTRNQWKPFYESEQPVMADLVLNYMPEKMIDQHYEGHFKRNEYIEGAYEASRFVPTLGKEGRWVSFSGAPLKDQTGNLIGAVEVLQDYTEKKAAAQHFDLMKKIARAEWDTLLFFYGVILCVGGLAQFGYLAAVSQYMYHDLGATWANVIVGFLSAVVDNIPVMFAVLTMDPAMSHGQWLLVTLTAGVGGSMLSIGSSRRGRPHGDGPGNLHLRRPPEMDACDYAGLCCQHCLSPVYQCAADVAVVSKIGKKTWASAAAGAHVIQGMMMKSASALVSVGLEDVRGMGQQHGGRNRQSAPDLVGNSHLARMARSGQQHHDPFRVLLQVVEAVDGHGRVPDQLGFTKTDEIHVAVAMGTEGTADKIPILTGHIAGDALQFSPLPIGK